MIKAIFAGTPDFAVPCLRALVEMGAVEVQAVYTQPDRPKGRGQQLQPTPVKAYAASQSLPVYQPEKLASPEVIQQLRDYAPDVMIVVAYGQILSAELLAIPAQGCINVHASLLPRWRGAAPIHRAIEAGDKETGVCLMQMDVGLDTGAVYAKASLPIEPESTTPQLHDQLAALGASLLQQYLPAIASGELSAMPQTESAVTYAHKLQKSEAIIDWTDTAENIARKVRAFQPWPGAQTTWAGQLVKLWVVSICLTADAEQPPGTVISVDSAGITVQCGEGGLTITSLQPAGKPRMSASAFANSRTLSDGRFG